MFTPDGTPRPRRPSDYKPWAKPPAAVLIAERTETTSRLILANYSIFITVCFIQCGDISLVHTYFTKIVH